MQIKKDFFENYSDFIAIMRGTGCLWGACSPKGTVFPS